MNQVFVKQGEISVEKELSISGRTVRIAKLRHEWFEFLENPMPTVQALHKKDNRADLFTFLQDLNDRQPQYPFYREAASAAVLPVTTYEVWWQSLDPRVRNKIRKAQKGGVEFRDVVLNEEFAQAVQVIYSESPIRQGRKFWHFGQSAASIHEELSSLFGRCHFVGAYWRNELIGFAKLFHGNNILRTVHIIGKLAQRDKPVQDGLIARAVEICEEQGIKLPPVWLLEQRDPRCLQNKTWLHQSRFLALLCPAHLPWKNRASAWLAPWFEKSSTSRRTSTVNSLAFILEQVSPRNDLAEARRGRAVALIRRRLLRFKGEVAEWSKAAFCKGCYARKSHRRFESFPSPQSCSYFNLELLKRSLPTKRDLDRACLPTFIGIGSMRCGSTWLYEVLKSHPEVRLADCKEVDFFFMRKMLRHDLDWYVEQFQPGERCHAKTDSW